MAEYDLGTQVGAGAAGGYIIYSLTRKARKLSATTYVRTYEKLKKYHKGGFAGHCSIV